VTPPVPIHLTKEDFVWVNRQIAVGENASLDRDYENIDDGRHELKMIKMETKLREQIKEVLIATMMHWWCEDIYK